LLILDGVPQSDPFGGWVNWPAYDPAALAEVRVVRGGGSVAHGSGALAGTIEMTSDFARGFAADVEGGSRESLLGRVRFGTAVGGGRLSLAARGARGAGFIPITAETRGPADRPAPYGEASIRALWTTPLSDDIDLQSSASGFTDRRERGLAFTANRTDGADASLRFVGRGAWQWSALGYVQWREFRSSFASISSGRTEAMRVSLQDAVPSRGVGGSVELRPPLAPGAELRVGADVRVTDGESRELFSYVAGAPSRRRIAGGMSATAGLFGEATVRLGRVTLSGGGRLDRWTIKDGELREWVIATGASLREDRFASRGGWLPTARAGAVIDLDDGFTLRSAAYLGWRMPTLNELFRPFRAGQDATAANPFLDPERLVGVEVGARYRTGVFALSLTTFANRLHDSIANVTLGHGPGVFPGVGFVPAGGEYRQRQNVDRINVQGLEASAEASRGPWSMQLGASVTDARVRAVGPAAQLDGRRPAQTAKFALTASVGWERSGRTVSLLMRHVDAQFEDDLNQRSLPAATTIDAFGAIPLTSRLQLVARGENLLNERVVAGVGGDGAIERATPRILWLGLRLISRRTSTGEDPQPSALARFHANQPSAT
jgi:outer membrane receptor protein involved in Fe transport